MPAPIAKPVPARRAARRGAWLVLALLAALAGAGHAASPEAELEYKVKAAFLYNFAKFVTWPPEKFAGPQSPIELCVLDPDPFGEILDETVRGKTIDGRPLLVRRSSQLDSLRSCHLLYAEGDDPGRIDPVFSRLADSSVMTVHSGDSTLRGGVARFFLDQRRVRFEINTASAERARLQLSARLQGVAVLVRE